MNTWDPQISPDERGCDRSPKKRTPHPAMAPIPTSAKARRQLVLDLVAEAQHAISKARWLRDVNRAYPGEAHDFGAAFAAIAQGRYALDLAAALSRSRHRAGTPGRKVAV